MKNIQILLSFLFFTCTLVAQSNLTGILSADFSKTKTGDFSSQNNCKNTGIIELAFLIDATSSMEDQLDFLKSEIKKTIQSVEKENDVQFQTSAIFYRDTEEEYLTKTSTFTSNLNKTIQFINQQKSAGGGDYAEALAEGLKATADLKWNELADTRLLFIFCDAPPHSDEVSKEKFQKAFDLIKSKNITCFSVIGTEANDLTNYTLQEIASQTNGATINLQAPNQKITEGTLLNNLVYKLITKETDLKECDSQIQNVTLDLVPNPAHKYSVVTSSNNFDWIKIITPEGKTIFTQGQLQTNSYRLDVSNFPAGIYFIQLGFGDRTRLEKLIINKK